MSQNVKRAKLFMVCPNQKYEQWLEQDRDAARISKNHRRARSLQQALDSLRKYPVRLKSAKECLILDKFSSKLVAELEEREKRENVVQGKARDDEESVKNPSSIDGLEDSTKERTRSEAVETAVSSQKLLVPSSVIQSLIVPSNVSKKRKNCRCAEPVLSDDQQNTPVPAFEPFTLSSFEVILLVDTAEQGFLSSLNDDARSLHSQNFEVRHLKVGDYAWVARGSCGRELMLPFIVERKRLDDVINSIKDGRFSEQKFRLKMSKIPNVILLVEYLEMRGDTKIIYQAISNTMVQPQFTVKETKNNIQTFRYLCSVTSFLSSSLRGKILERSREFSPFESLSSPNVIRLPEFSSYNAELGKIRSFTAKEMFTKQLVQLNGLSADKAWSITSKYTTPMAFIEAAEKNGPSFLADVDYGLLNRRIGPTSSSILHRFYTSLIF